MQGTSRRARFLGRAVDRLREQGRLGVLTQALVALLLGGDARRRLVSRRGGRV